MRLTLRTLIAYLDGTLDSGEAEVLRRKIEDSEFATALVDKINDSMRRGVEAPNLHSQGMGELNLVAEYLDNSLRPEQVVAFEQACLDCKVSLGEVASCHRILTSVLCHANGESDSLRRRLYNICPSEVASHRGLSGRKGAFTSAAPSLTESVRRLPMLGPWVTSLMVHLLLLLLLAIVVVPLLSESVGVVLTVATFDDSDDDLIASIELSENSSVDSLEPPLPDAIFDDAPTHFDDVMPEPPLVEELLLEREKAEIDAEPIDMLDDQNVASAGRPLSGTDEIRGGDHDKAASVIVGAMQRELDVDDTLVVWLIDKSVSLEDDRRLIAGHMEEFYRSIGGFNTRRRDYDGDHLLLNAVVAYGARSEEMSKPHLFGAHVCRALEEVPLDTSGIENVMTAIRDSVFYYRQSKHRSERMIFVVITDESGDDTAELEKTIEVCRRFDVAVHVIGPSAVFGAERGSHYWVVKGTDDQDYPFLLPVKRGPDTALPQRAFLPYWHESLLPPWTQVGVVPARNVPTHGGAYRERLLSGVGPYALTRLALQTGGSFTILDRVGDASTFDLETMRDYLPSYESSRKYVAAVKASRLRRALSETVVMSYRYVDALIPPRMAYIGSHSRFYPFSPTFSYVPPDRFRKNLVPSMEAEQRRVMNMHRALQSSLDLFRDKQVDWEYEYEQEDSKRWRAWYDLTKGRLLALSVRCMEYNASCDRIRFDLKLTTNRIALEPDTQLRVRGSREIAEEAARLLNRCLKENPRTPWAALAKWEIEKPMGIAVKQIVIPPPQPVGHFAPVRVRPPQQFRFPKL